MMLSTDAPASSPNTPPKPARPDEKLDGIAGWMAWFLLSMGFWAIVMLLRASELPAPFTNGTFELRHELPLVGPLVYLETIAHLAQIIGPVVGIVATVKRAPWTPRFWKLYLGGMIFYGLLDGYGGVLVADGMRALTGGQAVAELEEGVTQSLRQNGRFTLSALIWLRYWQVSKRVRATFRRGTAAQVAARAVATRVTTRPGSNLLVNSEPAITASEGIPLAQTSASRTERDCPQCGQSILRRARLCKYCHSSVDPIVTPFRK